MNIHSKFDFLDRNISFLNPLSSPRQWISAWRILPSSIPSSLVSSHRRPSRRWFRTFLDDKWGFVLEEGKPFTAPVWMGEFGYANQGEYWMNFLRYLSERDVDFGYWALNGKKYGEGYMDDHTGNFIDYFGCAGTHWEN